MQIKDDLEEFLKELTDRTEELSVCLEDPSNNKILHTRLLQSWEDLTLVKIRLQTILSAKEKNDE
ncbi:MAG: hypothetical protein V3W19_14295 [Desulfatiglandales bacterium]